MGNLKQKHQSYVWCFCGSATPTTMRCRGTAGIFILARYQKEHPKCEMLFLVALVGEAWNAIVSELKEWHSFGSELKREDLALYTAISNPA